jgi:hypothetical protein
MDNSNLRLFAAKQTTKKRSLFSLAGKQLTVINVCCFSKCVHLCMVYKHSLLFWIVLPLHIIIFLKTLQEVGSHHMGHTKFQCVWHYYRQTISPQAMLLVHISVFKFFCTSLLILGRCKWRRKLSKAPTQSN